MPLDPQAQILVEQMKAFNAPAFDTLTPEEARRDMKQIDMLGTPEPVAHVENRTIPGPAGDIPLRIYTPDGDGPFPILVFFHGGGWVLCDLDTHDGLCRSLSKRTGCIVVSVAYRLAPEHKFPAAPEDCFAATKWVASNAGLLKGDSRRMAIGGDSAGGNLSAVVAQLARDQGGPGLIFQLLIYPATTFTLRTASRAEMAEGYFLTERDMLWFSGHYLRSDVDKANPLASPLLASDLSRLPPTLVITAEYDPLRDEGELYGQRLKEAGNMVTIKRYDGMMHGFVSMPFLDQGQQAIAECVASLRSAFSQ